MGVEPATQGKSEESQEVVGEEPGGCPELAHASQLSRGVAGMIDPLSCHISSVVR